MINQGLKANKGNQSIETVACTRTCRWEWDGHGSLYRPWYRYFGRPEMVTSAQQGICTRVCTSTGMVPLLKLQIAAGFGMSLYDFV